MIGDLKKPFICHLADFCPEYGGSFIDSLLILAEHCRAKMGVQTICIFPERAKERGWLKRLDEVGVRYLFVPRRRYIVPSIREHLQNLNPLILHTHFFLFDVSAVLLKILFNRRPKVLWHYQNPVDQTFYHRAKNIVKIRLIGQYLVDKFIACGDYVYHSLTASGLPSRKIALVHNAVNTSKFSLRDGSREALRARFGISTDQTVFLLLGWDPIRKGIDVFAKAADEIIAKVDNNSCFFLVVGRQETREFVSRLQLSPRLSPRFRVIDPLEDLSPLLNAVDIFVSSSRSEGFPYAVLEAMAAGKLILSSSLPGARQTYGRAEGVWLFNTEDSNELAALMRRAISLSSIEKDSLGSANAEFVYRCYSLDVWADKIVELYTLLLKTS